MNGKIILVTGPARSGKSEWAEQLAIASHQSITYVATAQDNPDDPEWQARILQHQQRRSTDWQTCHCPHEFASLIHHSSAQDCLLIDSLGTWIANHLERDAAHWAEQTTPLHEALATTAAQIIIVAEETGWGVVPAYPLGRLFRDRLGTLTRAIAAQSHETYLVCAGIAINLKQIGQIVGGPNIQG